MRDPPDGGHRREIQGVARMQRESPYPALTQNHLVIPLRHDVLRGEQPFIERRGHATLQKDRQLRSSGASEQRKVLHIARPDLNDVAVLLNQIHSGKIERFRHDL